MSNPEDHIPLSTGSKYAYGRIVGLSLDPEDMTIYYGHDGYIGENDGSLTDDEKRELGWLMIQRWGEFLKKLY